MKETIFLCVILLHSEYAILNSNADNFKGNVTTNRNYPTGNKTQEILMNRMNQTSTSSPSSSQRITASRNPYRHFFSGGSRTVSYLPHKSSVKVQSNVSRKTPPTSYTTTTSTSTPIATSLNPNFVPTLEKNQLSMKESSDEIQRNKTQQFSTGVNFTPNDQVTTSTKKDTRIQDSVTTGASYITPSPSSTTTSTTPMASSSSTVSTEELSTSQSTPPPSISKESISETHRFSLTGDDLIKLGYPTLYSFFANQTFRVDLASLGNIFSQNLTGQSISSVDNPAWEAIAKNGTLREEFYSLIDRIYRNITSQNSDVNGHKKVYSNKNYSLSFDVVTHGATSKQSSTPLPADNEPKPKLVDSQWNIIKVDYPSMASLYYNRTFQKDLENVNSVFSPQNRGRGPLMDALRSNETVREEMLSYFNKLSQDIAKEQGFPPQDIRSFLRSRIGVQSPTTTHWLTPWPVSSTTMKNLDKYSNPKDFWLDNPGEELHYLNIKVRVEREPNTSYSRTEFHEFLFHKNDFLTLGYPTLYSVTVNGTIRFDVKNEFAGTPESHKGWLNIYEMIQNNDTLADEMLSLINRMNNYLSNKNATNDPQIDSFAAYSGEDAPALITPSNSSNLCAFEIFSLEKYNLVIADDPMVIFRHFTDDLIREMRNGFKTVFRQILRGEVHTPNGNFRDFLINGGASHIHILDENSNPANVNENDPSNNDDPSLDSNQDASRIRVANKILLQKLYEYLTAGGTNLRLSTRMRCAFNSILREYDFRNHDYYNTSTTEKSHQDRYNEVRKRFMKILTGKEPSNTDSYEETSFLTSIFEAALADAVY